MFSKISEMDTSHSKSNGDVPLPNSDTYGLLKITITEQKLTVSGCSCSTTNVKNADLNFVMIKFVTALEALQWHYCSLS